MIDTTPDNPRRQVYEIVNESELSLADKQRNILEIGRSVLDVENGHIERIDPADNTNEVILSVGGGPDFLPTGAQLDRATTYCRRTIEQHSPLALSNASEQGWATDPAYETHEFECYLGTTIFTDGEPYGTICFISRDARETDFDAEEKSFVELLARLIGREIEATQHEQSIEKHRRKRKQSERKFESLLTAAPDAIILADAETGQLVEVNDATRELTGYDRDELLEMNLIDLHPPADRERYDAEFTRLLAEPGTIDRFPDGSPLYIQDNDGEAIPIELSADRIELDNQPFLMGIVRDISDRRERERDLEIKNRAIETASVGISIADATAEDLPLIYVNEEFERITGYPPDDVLGENCRFLQGPDTETTPVNAIRDALENEAPITTELLNYRADGTPFWNELTLTPVTTSTGETTHYVGFQRDITSRKRREQVISVLNRVLRHNLRNDLNAVIGYADALTDHVDAAQRQRLERIKTLANDLVAVSQKARTIEQTINSPGQCHDRSLLSLLEETQAELHQAYPAASIDIEGCPDQTVPVSTRFGDALYELGENAIVHGGATPRVTFRVGRAEDRPGWVTVAVEDNGPGLPGHEQRVLENGRETVLEHGSGIGLWLVNWLTTMIGGEVTTTVDEQGTTVTLRLRDSVDDGADADVVDRPSALTTTTTTRSDD